MQKGDKALGGSRAHQAFYQQPEGHTSLIRNGSFVMTVASPEVLVVLWHSWPAIRQLLVSLFRSALVWPQKEPSVLITGSLLF